MKQKFTPGPWEAVCLGSEGYFIRTEEPGKTLRQREYRYKIAEVNDGYCWGDIKYNAQLIAATPELYEAAKKLCDKLVTEYGFSSSQHELSMLMKAITKAEGGE